MNKPVEIVVGRGQDYDPVAGTTECPMPLYAGQDLWVEKTGYGTYDYNKYQTLSGGGFRLVGAGNTFVNCERFYVHFTGLSYSTDQTSYTNGFDYAKVMNALFGRIGWTEGGIDLTTLNELSKSGRHFDEFHSLVTVDNVNDTMPNPDADLNAYLTALQRGVIMRALNGVLKSPEYISQKILFNRLWPSNDTPITNRDQFVGLLFKPAPKVDLGNQIDALTLYFDSDVTFNMYLYHETVMQPLAVVQVSAVANTQTVVALSDFILNYINSNSMGGVFYFGYYQSDLGGAKAYQEQYSDLTCDTYSWSFMESDKTADYSFNRRQVRLTNVNFGLNFHVSTFRDHTQQIVKKAPLFDNLIGLQMAAQVVEQIVYTPRSNGRERVLKEGMELAAQLDLNGVAPINDSPYKPGLKGELAKEYKAVYKAFLPCPPSKTVNNVDYWG